MKNIRKTNCIFRIIKYEVMMKLFQWVQKCICFVIYKFGIAELVSHIRGNLHGSHAEGQSPFGSELIFSFHF